LKNRFFIKNPLYLILSTIMTVVLLGALFYATLKLEHRIAKQMMEISTSDILHIIDNNARALEAVLEPRTPYVEQIEAQKDVLERLERTLGTFLTANIKHAYLLYRDKNGIFRFIADGARGEERGMLHQKFDIDNPRWLEVYETKKPLLIENKLLQSLSLTYLVPILQYKEVSMVMAVDFSIKKVENINNILLLMQNGLVAIIVIVLVFLVLLSVQTFRYLAVKKKAYLDKLTGVYNRNYLQESQDFINLHDYVLATLDIDNFKVINDTYGHDTGDLVLRHVANTVSMSTRAHEDIVIRYGGEEFIVLAKTKRDDTMGALNVIERVFKNIQETPFWLSKEEPLYVTVSIGVNLSPYKSRTFQEAFKLADISLYHAKNKGRNRIEIYNEQEESGDSLHMSINDIKEAIEENRVVCYYQKIVDNTTQEISHYEALLRIQEKDGTIVTPDKILPMIQGTFLLRNITKSVLAICHAKLQEDKEIKINVNLNPKDIVNDAVLALLQNYAAEEGISTRLGLELVESEDIFRSEDAKKNLLMLKNLGYKIFIDDFGSGYSNFIYLTQIKTDYIKIDGSIIKNILDDKISYLLVKSIVSFAKEANIKVIAEYVSSQEIYEKVTLLGIDYSQGFYFSVPKPL